MKLNSYVCERFNHCKWLEGQQIFAYNSGLVPFRIAHSFLQNSDFGLSQGGLAEGVTYRAENNINHSIGR